MIVKIKKAKKIFFYFDVIVTMEQFSFNRHKRSSTTEFSKSFLFEIRLLRKASTSRNIYFGSMKLIVPSKTDKM